MFHMNQNHFMMRTTIVLVFDVEGGGVLISEAVAVETRVDWLRYWGKRKENSRFEYLFGARISTVVARTLQRNLKNVRSTGRDVVSGTLILLPAASEKATPVRLEIRKKEREID